MRAKNSSSNSSAMEIPQYITESLANGLTSKPIDLDCSENLKQFLVDFKNETASISSAMGMPQCITDSLVNGLATKTIDVDYSAKLDQLLIDNQKELDAMVSDQRAILFYSYGLKPLYVRIWLYARFYSRRCLNKFLLIPLMKWQIRRKMRNIQQSPLWLNSSP